MDPRTTTALLYLDGVSVSFDGFRALNNLSFTIEPGEMRAIIGPNGAGKTTMMDVVTGKTRPDTGDVYFDGAYDLSRLDETEIALLGIIRLGAVRSRVAGSLSHGQKQWLEIGMLLMQDPELLMLDEPIAGMSVKERELTAALLERICRDRSMIVIEHDMEFVKKIAHKVTVMHQGKVLAEGPMDKVQADPRVIDVYLGH